MVKRMSTETVLGDVPVSATNSSVMMTLIVMKMLNVVSLMECDCAVAMMGSRVTDKLVKLHFQTARMFTTLTIGKMACMRFYRPAGLKDLLEFTANWEPKVDGRWVCISLFSVAWQLK